jgi:4-hydroxy-tetrahydrodipicolinate synthase
MQNKKYQGIVVPMATPLTGKLRIDTGAVDRIIERFAENRLSPFVLGTTGESASISRDESEALVAQAVRSRRENQLVYAGLMENNMAEALDRARRYAGLGVDVVVATLPSYYTLTPTQMEAFYTQLADRSPCPVMMYNIVATTQMSIPLERVDKLSHHPNIVGLKDSERNPDRLQLAVDAWRDRSDFSFFCGWGAMGLHSLQIGADGIVPSTANVVPELYGALYNAFLQQNDALASELQTETDRIAAVYQQGRTLGQSLAALKVLMERRGLCQRFMMPPLTSLAPEDVDEIPNFQSEGHE